MSFFMTARTYYQYDADGNQVARWIDNNSAGVVTAAHDTNITIYTWDNRNRLFGLTRRLPPTAADHPDRHLPIRRLQPLDRRNCDDVLRR